MYTELDAVNYYFICASHGDTTAMYELSKMFRMGNGLPVDVDAEMFWLKMSADSGNSLAQCDLGLAHYWGEGVEKNLELAFKYCSLSAAQGCGKAAYCCGLAYQHGEGVEQDFDKAIEYHQAAIQNHYVEAYVELFRAIVRSGRTELYDEGFAALKKGATLGNKDCQYGLSMVYEVGIYGAPCNQKKAAYWRRKYCSHTEQ